MRNFNFQKILIIIGLTFSLMDYVFSIEELRFGHLEGYERIAGGDFLLGIFGPMFYSGILGLLVSAVGVIRRRVPWLISLAMVLLLVPIFSFIFPYHHLVGLFFIKIPAMAAFIDLIFIGVLAIALWRRP